MSQVRENGIHKLSGRTDISGIASVAPVTPTILTFTVGPNSYNDFADIQSAVDAAGGAASNNPVCIVVEEGEYPGFTISTDWVSVHGKGISTHITSAVVMNNSNGELRNLWIQADVSTTVGGKELRMIDCYMSGNITGSVNGALVVLDSVKFFQFNSIITISQGVGKLSNVTSDSGTIFSPQYPSLSFTNKVDLTAEGCTFYNVNAFQNGGGASWNYFSGCRFFNDTTLSHDGLIEYYSCAFEGNVNQTVQCNLGCYNCKFDSNTTFFGQVEMRWCYFQNLTHDSAGSQGHFFDCLMNGTTNEHYGATYRKCYFIGPFIKSIGVGAFFFEQCYFLFPVTVSSLGGGTTFSCRYSNGVNPAIDCSGALGQTITTDGYNVLAGGVALTNAATATDGSVLG